MLDNTFLLASFYIFFAALIISKGEPLCAFRTAWSPVRHRLHGHSSIASLESCDDSGNTYNRRAFPWVKPLRGVGRGRQNTHLCASVGCPFLHQPLEPLPGLPPLDVQKAYGEALDKLDWDAVKADVRQLFRDSKEWWPADYGHYGGLFIRLAWHSTGTYRMSDGRGGADGGGQRFDPERSWEDNTNLDKARRLLEPIKLKYGLGLSWGDLFVMAGTLAIEDMGGPVLGFCGGRIDYVDNTQTRSLGPSPEQEKFAECPTNGQCPAPLGQNTLGLIYVNPEGPMGEPDPQGAANTIRDVFGRMNMGDRENVALIGGGHTFGKAHGAGPDGPGATPAEDPANPYPGEYKSGKGNDAVTSGIEGPWTSHPIRWDNDYFRYLIDFEWEPHKGPGGAWQWRVKGGNGPKAPMAHPSGTDETQDVMMLTTDVALAVDPKYRVFVEEFANDEEAFRQAFAEVWYKLVNRDMGPYTRCVGPDVAPPQPFQYPLPDPLPEEKLADMTKVETSLKKVLDEHPEGEFIRLASQSANTYRATDYLGGCNGARIRFSPGKDWKINEGLEKTLDILNPIKEEFGEGLSWADLIVLAGNVAVKNIGAPDDLPFCPGRTDATDGSGWESLAYGNAKPPKNLDDFIERFERRGLSAKEFVSYTLFPMFPNTAKLNEYLGKTTETEQTMQDTAMKYHPDLRHWVEYYVATGDETYKNDFGMVWTKMMNADRFDGPVGNVCYV